MTFKGVLGAMLVALVVTAFATADRLVPPPVTGAPAVTGAPSVPVAGQWICPMVADLPATSASVIVVGIEGDDAEVDVSVLSDGSRRAVSDATVAPSAALRSEVGAAVRVAWSGAPVAAFREWWFQGGDLPPGIVSGGCVHGLSDRWFVPGLKTSGGAEARLRVTNPFRTDATIAVSFATPEGPAEPLALQNLSIGAQSTLEIVVNESLPERDDLAAIVSVQTGRVVTEGMQLMRSAIGGIDGATLLQAAPEPAENWVIPWIVDGPDTSSWLWIYNPDQRSAAVELTYHTSDGGVVADGLDEVLVEPGTVRRVDLRGTMPDGVDVAAIAARVSGASIVVSGAVEVDAADPSRTGMAVQLGAATSERWVIGGGDATGRDEQLHLVNPTSASTTVDVAVRSLRGLRRPTALQDIEVPAGSTVRIDLGAHLGDSEHWTVHVDAQHPGIVAGRVGGAREGHRRLVAWPGVPESSWRIVARLHAASMQEGLVQRLRTEFGLRREDPFATGPLAPRIEDDPGDPDRPGAAGRSGRGADPAIPSVPGGIGTDDEELDDEDDEAGEAPD